MSGSDAGQGQPPPGWYPDPDQPGNRRWWDGIAWTDFSEPVDPSGTGPASGGHGDHAGPDAGGDAGSQDLGQPGGPQGGQPGGPPGGHPGGSPGGQGPAQVSGSPGAHVGGPTFAGAGPVGPAPNIDTWLWQSIVATVLCCLPLGIPGIVFASQAQTEKNNGNYPLAREKAKQAKTFTLISAGLGLLMWFGWIGLFFVPFMLMPMGY